ncbi:ran-binding protein 3 isoform X15 [Ictidomys tridecemlineatus]
MRTRSGLRQKTGEPGPARGLVGGLKEVKWRTWRTKKSLPLLRPSLCFRRIKDKSPKEESWRHFLTGGSSSTWKVPQEEDSCIVPPRTKRPPLSCEQVLRRDSGHGFEGLLRSGQGASEFYLTRHPFFSGSPKQRSAGGSSPEAGEDSDREDGNYCPPVKRERTSSLTQFPPSQSEEKSSGFRLKPPTLIHGQAPSAVPSSGTNGVSIPADCMGAATSLSPENPARRSPSESADEAHALEEKEPQKNESSNTSEEENCEKKDQVAQQSFVFGQNLRDRVKLVNENTDVAGLESAGQPSSDTPAATNYFLQYISSSLENTANSADASSNKFVFGQNMSERVLSFPKLNEVSSDASRENAAAESGSESSSQEATPEKANNIAESLVESAAAYTKATARKCLLEKVEVITGEEAESNVLQTQCKLFVFDKTSQSWVERGRGLLRLNDMASTDDGTLQSRLVMRTQGSLRLILNTKLWAQMQMDKASEKSIRITAMDTEDQGVKVFLISASSKDTGQLYAALHHRILALRSRVEQEQEAKMPAPEPGAAPSHEEDDSDDDVLAPSGAAGAGAGEEGDGQTPGST